MTYSYLPHDPSHYSYALRLSENRANLQWDTSRGVDTLVVRTPFGVSAAALMPELCPELGHFELRQEQFVEIRAGIWIRYVTAGARARMNGGCPLYGEACTYAVFACRIQGDECSVYAPSDRGVNFPTLDVPLRVHVEVFPVTKMGGVLRRKPVFTGFYGIGLPGPGMGVPGDGTLRYAAGDMVIPVTDGMMAQGAVYVKTDVEPRIFSANPGLQLE